MVVGTFNMLPEFLVWLLRKVIFYIARFHKVIGMIAAKPDISMGEYKYLHHQSLIGTDKTFYVLALAKT
jgi:hypothetical protein